MELPSQRHPIILSELLGFLLGVLCFCTKNGRGVLCFANSLMIDKFLVDYRPLWTVVRDTGMQRFFFFPQKPLEIVGVCLLDRKTSQSSPILLIVKLVGVCHD